MVKALILGLLAATMMCGLASAAPAHAIAPEHQQLDAGTNDQQQQQHQQGQEGDFEDPVARSERSTNLSHITGTARKIQMYIKNRYLQILVDGTVNGTTDDTSAYTILQRTSVGIGKMKIQGVATCQYLCMDSCGLLYGSREFGDECVFNETIEQHNYNTYSSTKYSNDRRTLYLALNRRGQPRKVLLRARQQLGRLSSYTRVLTRTVSPERAEELQHPLRHRGHVCQPPSPTVEQNPTTDQQPMNEHPRCRKKKKRKKKKRKCQEGDADGGEPCQKRQTPTNTPKLQTKLVKQCDSKNSDECQRVEVTMKKKSKSKLSDTQVLSGFKKKKSKKHIKKRLRVSASSVEVTDAPAEDVSADEDYAVEATTTTWDFEDSTALPVMPAADDTGTTHPD